MADSTKPVPPTRAQLRSLLFEIAEAADVLAERLLEMVTSRSCGAHLAAHLPGIRDSLRQLAATVKERGKE